MKQARVLLANAHRAMLEGLMYLLEPTFEIVGLVDDAESLFEAADTLKPDVVVADLPIALSNEVDPARQLKNRNAEVGVIILSVYDDPAVMRQALDAGALGFVLMRSVAWDLIPAIQAVLRGQTYVSPGVRWR